MFRKDTGLIDSWMERGPEYYSALQKEILDTAVQMLKPGGMILYSTCTFAKEEDEVVIAYILERYPELELVQPELSEGFVKGASPYEKCIRIWPHKVKGEGHFLALLHKKEDDSYAGELPRYTEKEIAASQKKMPEEMRDFLKLLPRELWENSMFELIGEQCLLIPPYRLPKRLRFLRTGVQAGTWKKGRFEPSQQLAMLLDAASYPMTVNLSSQDTRVIRYLKGETIDLEEHECRGLKGWVLICTDGYALGWGKYANGSIKNKYYPGWRLQ